MVGCLIEDRIDVLHEVSVVDEAALLIELVLLNQLLDLFFRELEVQSAYAGAEL